VVLNFPNTCSLRRPTSFRFCRVRDARIASPPFSQVPMRALRLERGAKRRGAVPRTRSSKNRRSLSNIPRRTSSSRAGTRRAGMGKPLRGSLPHRLSPWPPLPDAALQCPRGVMGAESIVALHPSRSELIATVRSRHRSLPGNASGMCLLHVPPACRTPKHIGPERNLSAQSSASPSGSAISSVPKKVKLMHLMRAPLCVRPCGLS